MDGCWEVKDNLLIAKTKLIVGWKGSMEVGLFWELCELWTMVNREQICVYVFKICSRMKVKKTQKEEL